MTKYLIGEKIKGKLIAEQVISSDEVLIFVENLVEMWEEEEDTEEDVAKFRKLINDGEEDLMKYESVVPNFLGYENFIGVFEDDDSDFNLKIIINGEKYNLECTK
jgi:hypothetical protein